jgi:hypothetical protein
VNDDRLIRELRALDRPIGVDADFADRLFERLRAERRPHHRRLPFLLLAAALLIGGLLGAVAIGGGGLRPPNGPPADVTVRHEWALPTRGKPVRIEYAVPSDLELVTTDGGTYLAFTQGHEPYVLDGRRPSLPAGARGVKITDVAGAVAHYSNNRPLGLDAASFLAALGTHPALGVDLGQTVSMRLGSLNALTADLRSAAPDAHLDNDGVMIDLWPPSRLIVSDVGDAIVLIQIWAATPEALAQWLPNASRLVDTIRARGTG